MKYFVIGATLLWVAIVSKGCATEKKVAYEFPSGMLATVRPQYEKICDKGQILYDLNCGGCHNAKVKGKTIIPDFTVEQLEAYKIRVMNAKHEEQLTESNMTEEELGMIITFFTYKKKNNLPIPEPKVHNTATK